MLQLGPYRPEWPVVTPDIWVCGPTASVLNSMAHVTTKSYVNTLSQVSHLTSCWCLRDMRQPGPCRIEWPALLPKAMVTSGPELQLITTSVLMSKVPITIEGRVDDKDLRSC